jgi:hypothetical protein
MNQSASNDVKNNLRPRDHGVGVVEGVYREIDVAFALTLLFTFLDDTN